jgi:hypothetical protein
MARKVIAMEKEITLNGYVEEIELENGKTGVILDDGDVEYCVVLDKVGQRLMDHIDEEVEATGMMSINDGERMLKVFRFHAVDYYEDDDFEYGDMDDYWNA